VYRKIVAPFLFLLLRLLYISPHSDAQEETHENTDVQSVTKDARQHLSRGEQEEGMNR
jgi:hypothetical protein